MSLAHLTLPTREVEKTASFLEETLGYLRDPVPANVPDETVWLNIGRGQQMHVFFVEGASPPNTLPIEAVNIACAEAEPSSAANAAAAARM